MYCRRNTGSLIDNSHAEKKKENRVQIIARTASTVLYARISPYPIVANVIMDQYNDQRYICHEADVLNEVPGAPAQVYSANPLCLASKYQAHAAILAEKNVKYKLRVMVTRRRGAARL